jgi:hypothetical protein
VKFYRNYCIVILVFFIAALYGCANIVPPSGGDKDTTPPILLSTAPADSGLNVRRTKIELRFNKYMVVKELDKNIQLSPILATTPVVMANGRKVTITIPDSQLTVNTTYRIGLGDALTDNRENTPYKNFVYVFSTGSYFDSLELHGRVLDAKTGMADSAILLALYEVGESDTAVLRKKPKYATRIDASGNFVFKSLPARKFKMYAIQDVNSNYIYDYGDEKIGFLNQEVMPSLQDSINYTFYTFKEWKDTATMADIVDTSISKDTLAARQKLKGEELETKRKLYLLRRFSKLSKTNIGYKVLVDTGDVTTRSFDIRLPLSVALTTYIQSLDTPKVYLSYDNDGIEVEAVQRLHVDSGTIHIFTQWLGDKVYTLRLVKGWAKDSSGNELPPGKYKFKTKGDPDYSSLIIHIGKVYLKDSMLLDVFQGKDSAVYTQKITDSVVTIKLLNPGNYNMQVIEDANNNGRWDPGILLKRIQPEKVINYNASIVLKAGWDNEVDFTEASGKPLEPKDTKSIKDKKDAADKPGKKDNNTKPRQ